MNFTYLFIILLEKVIVMDNYNKYKEFRFVEKIKMLFREIRKIREL